MKENRVKPIILLVSERSGSNLLRTLLGRHSQIQAPIAPHFLAESNNSCNYYGNLNHISNREKLCDDMLALVNQEFNNWEVQKDKVNVMSGIHS